MNNRHENRLFENDCPFVQKYAILTHLAYLWNILLRLLLNQCVNKSEIVELSESKRPNRLHILTNKTIRAFSRGEQESEKGSGICKITCDLTVLICN